MTVCPACEQVSTTCYRCEHCGRDLVNIDDDDDAAPVRTDGGRERGGGNEMPRVTLRIPEALLEDIEDIAEEHYPTRTEAMREALRDFVADQGGEQNGQDDQDDEHDPHTRSYLRTDGGRSPARASDRDPRPASRERIERDEARQRGGVGDQYVGRCDECREDELPCLDCFLSCGGDA